MAERERKQKPAPKEREEVVDEEVAATSERGEKLKEDIDDLLGRNRLRARRQRRGVRSLLRAEGRAVSLRTSDVTVTPAAYDRS